MSERKKRTVDGIFKTYICLAQYLDSDIENTLGPNESSMRLLKDGPR